MPFPTANRRNPIAASRYAGPQGHSAHGSALYGYGYNPSWPSILSVAHDEDDGGALFVITDRPCYLSGSAFGLPLTILGAGGSPLVPLSAVQTIVPVKFRLSMSGAVPAHAPWSWGPMGPAGDDLRDPITGHPVNAASGDCADFPGAYVPPPPANVVSSNYGTLGMGGWATLTFDAPVILAAPGVVPDDAVTFGASYVATSVAQETPYTLYFELATGMTFGSPWFVNRQPAWVANAVSWPAAGSF